MLCGKGREVEGNHCPRKGFLFNGYSFRLVDPDWTRETGVEFHLRAHQPQSIDGQFRDILFRIESDGNFRHNKKGNKYTDSHAVSMEIDLYSHECKCILPFNTLRHIGSRPAVIKALWYLRGQDSSLFCKRTKTSSGMPKPQKLGWVLVTA